MQMIFMNFLLIFQIVLKKSQRVLPAVFIKKKAPFLLHAGRGAAQSIKHGEPQTVLALRLLNDNMR